MRQNGLEDVVPCDDAAVPQVAAIACALKRVALWIQVAAEH
jgi:hypothetical protein